MINSQKNISVSKRHVRRIIANETNIDIAGSSRQIVEHSNTVNICIKDYLDLQKCSHENIENIENDSIPLENRNLYLLPQNISNERDNNNESLNCNIVNININNEDNDKKFKNAIAEWAVSYNIPHNACNALLKVLQKHTSCNFSKDTRTLLKIPRQNDVIKICGGEYFYLGLYNIIKKMILKSNDKCIDLLVNVDGLPIAKSSHASLWPILCSNTKNNAVYLVGAFFGYKKPENSNIYLEPLVNDLIELTREGYLYVIKIRLFNLICDAPAKSFVLCVKGHTGFYSYTKCVIKRE